MRIAGMVRHAASDRKIATALGLSADETARLVLGHAEAEGDTHIPVDGPRFAFVPVPSIEARGKNRSEVVGSIRRVLVMGVQGHARENLIALAQSLSGHELIEERSGNRVALLSRIPDSDSMVRRYTQRAVTWATVTPVILPGYDDPRKYRRRLASTLDAKQPGLDSIQQKQLLAKLDQRIDFLLRKAIRQSGLSVELARYADLDWRSSGFWPGTDLASRYAIPEKLRRFRRLHVRITWRDAQGNSLAVPGPLCLGGGRFIGLGLFAAFPAP
jgi:CRISPR-associated protein Csb2